MKGRTYIVFHYWPSLYNWEPEEAWFDNRTEAEAHYQDALDCLEEGAIEMMRFDDDGFYRTICSHLPGESVDFTPKQEALVV